MHATNLLAKLGARSRLEAAATACRLGLEQPTALERQVPGPAGRGRSSILALIRNQSDPRGRAPSR